MARSGLVDPLTKFRWTVHIEGFSRLGFTTCGTPSYTIMQKEYPEGGRHLNPLSIIDGIRYNPITLTRGVTNDTSFNKWASGFIDLVTNNAALKDQGTFIDVIKSPSKALQSFQDNHTRIVPSSDKYPFSYRRNVKIEHVNRSGVVEVTYILYNAYPIEYKPASDFDAKADDTISIESITLAYEGFEVKYSGLLGSVANMAIKSGIIGNILKI